ncbi:hypothetical protein E2C01_023752 [Portunus trituberculatus]|uniref:Uncharacterized protein n=1 Tax=Portunus trituberculatus TaxID=210409 RepID=A0A5B7EAV8_PORTR|nr:hypothetical protein [Portunus trituberculatus]
MKTNKSEVASVALITGTKGSRRYEATEATQTPLDLQLQSEDGGDLSDFIKNGEWDLIGK